MNSFFKKVSIVCLGFLPVLIAPAFGQSKTGSSTVSAERAAQRKNAFVRKVKEKGLIRDPNWYYRYKIDVTKDRALSEEGVNLSVLDRRAGSGTYRENMIYTTTVVRGSVIGKRYDARKDVYFHSMYDIRVEEVVAGQVNAEVITVCLRSGKIGDGYLNAADEPGLFLGEEVMLYLNPINSDELREAKEQGLWNYTDNSDPGSYNLVEKYYVKSDYVYDSDDRRIDKTATVKAGIKRVATLLDKASFDQKSFE